jgi:hypothetical protein
MVTLDLKAYDFLRLDDDNGATPNRLLLDTLEWGGQSQGP